MRRAILTLAFLVAMSGACRAQDSTTVMPANDPAMAAAEKQARATLPNFWAHVDGRDPTVGFRAVKVGFPTPRGAVEFLWIFVESHSAADLQGRVVNAPEEVPDLHVRQRVPLSMSRVVDWTYQRGGRFFGQYTTRVMLQHLDAETRAAEGARLSPDPLEPEVH